ncbi:meiosis initiator protein-like [Coregonus clupeaformis]|uniref:meiosis initiator protein-like n=1 Tax=Coregonus clupeaformis TaxID=59861 RepID=UPI001BDF92F5|nr:meiosis initiator protein-like [Coregonus clupeaformis]
MSLNSTHAGTPSTMVTKELASLWHVMPKQERRVYCLKACRFSRQQNRNVRSEFVEGEGDREEEDCVPSPLHMLLAQRDLCAASRGGS